MDFSVASERQEWIESKATPRLGGAARVPAGLCHAVAEGATETMCGIAVERLALFPEMPFPGVSAPRHRECERAVEAARAG